MTDVGGIAGDRLRSFIERVERLNEEVRALNADKSEIFKEAKATGFDPKTMKRCIQLRAMDTADRDEQEHLTDLYMRALEIGTSIATHVPARAEDSALAPNPANADADGSREPVPAGDPSAPHPHEREEADGELPGAERQHGGCEEAWNGWRHCGANESDHDGAPGASKGDAGTAARGRELGPGGDHGIAGDRECRERDSSRGALLGTQQISGTPPAAAEAGGDVSGQHAPPAMGPSVASPPADFDPERDMPAFLRRDRVMA